MAVGTFIQPLFGTQQPSEVKTNIQNCIAVLARLGAAFAPHEQDTPDMTVRVDAGVLPYLVGGARVEQAAQNTATITAPSVNPRIDLVVIDNQTAAVAVITGEEAASPVAPNLPAGKWPIAEIALATSTTEITNDLITDERLAGGTSLPETTAENDFIVGNESGAWTKKTLAETKAILGQEWQLFGSVELTNQNTYTFSGLTPGKTYRLEIQLMMGSYANSQIALRFNGDSEGYYDWYNDDSNSINSNHDATYLALYGYQSMQSSKPVEGSLIITPFYGDNTRCMVRGSTVYFNSGYPISCRVGGDYKHGTANITSLTLFETQAYNFSGKLLLWEKTN
jgi:hypothetical protein